jgi:tetratricopeptide (TPR) repeat protein
VRAILGLSYYMTDQYRDAAQTILPLGDAVWKDPALAYAWADSLVKESNFKQAGEVLAKLEGVQLTSDMRMQVAHAWEAIGNYNRAVETYHQLSETAPTLPKAHYYAGLAYIHADRPADAAAEFKAELGISPEDPDARYNPGFVNLQLGQRQEAISLSQSVTSSHPTHADAQYQLGKLLLDEGKVKDAIVHLETAVRLSPQSDYMHYQLQAAYRADSRILDADRELAIYKDVKARKRAQAANKTERGSDQN